ncbi:hypothetical protein [Paenibacillus terrigena]|uniref:hypothetical protein n=1 Tax=Paenibacillus terrigena TaxID=369333 RepID=UPI0028D39C16|nr:hypothetical protein [Paenibacillus terrigena]
MSIFFDGNKIFGSFNGLVPGKTSYQFVFRNETDQPICDLHMFTTGHFPGISPLFTKIKLQTNTNAKTVVLGVPTNSLDIDIKSFFGFTSCIPNTFPENLFILTIYFNRPFTEFEGFQIAPSNFQGDIIVAGADCASPRPRT